MDRPAPHPPQQHRGQGQRPGLAPLPRWGRPVHDRALPRHPDLLGGRERPEGLRDQRHQRPIRAQLLRLQRCLGDSGDNPNSIEGGFQTNILVDQNHGIVVSSAESGSSAGTGRCFYRGWNVLVTPPQLLWTTFCTPPQPGGNLPVDPSWDIQQVQNMTGAEIFYPGPQYNGGGPIPGTAVVNLKSLSQSQLNATLYNDWGYANQTPACLAADAG